MNGEIYFLARIFYKIDLSSFQPVPTSGFRRIECPVGSTMSEIKEKWIGMITGVRAGEILLQRVSESGSGHANNLKL